MAEIEAADKDFDRAYAVSGTNDPVAGLKTLEAVVAAHPTFAGCSYLLGPTLELLIKNDRAAEARAIAEKAVAKAVGRGDVVALRTVRSALLIDAARKETSLAAIAVKAAELDRELTGADDAGATVRLAGAYAAAGDAAKAAVLGAEGVALAEKAVKGDKDWQGLLLLASAHDAAGDKAKAKAAAEKAVAAVGDQGGLKEHVASQAKKYGVEGKAPAGPK
jgi:tetratricopeptide (TPR) repeat protein